MPRRKKNIDLDIDTSKGDLDIDKSKRYLDIDVDEKALPTKGKGKRGRPKGAKTVNSRKANSWMDLIKKIKADNPGMSHKEAMQAASKVKDKYGGSAEALGAGVSFKGILKTLGNVAKKGFDVGKKASKQAFKTAKKIAESKEFREGAKAVGRTALQAAAPTIEKAGHEAIGRYIAGEKPTHKFSDIAKSGAKDITKQVAHHGLREAERELKTRSPAELRPIIGHATQEAHKRVERQVGTGVVGKYLKDCEDICDKCKHKQQGGFIGALLGALAPAVVPLAADLIGNVVKKVAGKGIVGKMSVHGQGVAKYHQTPTDRLHEAEPHRRGRGTPGDYSFNELGVYKGQSGTGAGGNLFEHQRSDDPLDNILARRSNLFQFIPAPGLIGITETPENQFYTPHGVDENVELTEMLNDTFDYIDDAPTYEDGVTTTVPLMMTINPNTLSEMPQDTSIRSTIAEINAEASGRGMRGGFVYAPGMSLSAQAAYQEKLKGRGIVGSMSQGSGILPSESVITGTPIGISSRGRGIGRCVGRNGGSLIKGSNVATWS